MRGQDAQQGQMWSYVQPEQRVPHDHPLRPIRAMVDQALRELSPRFALLYSHTGRPSRHPGYAISQRYRKRVEEVSGWLKTIGQLRKLHHRGTALVNWVFLLRTTAYNLLRMRNLLAAVA